MKKVVVAILAIIALWWLVQIPSVINAIMLFCALGVNPFTGRDITPASMAELLGVVLFISVLLLFRKEIKRSAKRRREQSGAELEAAIADVVNQPQPAPVMPSTAVMFDAATGATVPQMVMQPLPQLPEAGALTGMRRASTRHQRKQLNLNATVHRWWLHVGEPTMFAKLSIVRRTLRMLARNILHACRAVWRTFGPHARRFDRWLERKVHANQTGSALVAVGREMENSLREWARLASSLRRNEAVQDLLRAFRR